MRFLVPNSSLPGTASLLPDGMLTERLDEIERILTCWEDKSPAGAFGEAMRNYAPALLLMLLATTGEMSRRGMLDPGARRFGGWWDRLKKAGVDINVAPTRPLWFHLEATHHSHQSYLIRKDPGRFTTHFPWAPIGMPRLYPAPGGLALCIYKKDIVKLRSGEMVLPKRYWRSIQR